MALDKGDLKAIKGIVEESASSIKEFVGHGFDGMHEVIGNVEENLTELITKVGGMDRKLDATISSFDNHDRRISRIETKLKIKK